MHTRVSRTVSELAWFTCVFAHSRFLIPERVCDVCGAFK